MFFKSLFNVKYNTNVAEWKNRDTEENLDHSLLFSRYRERNGAISCEKVVSARE